MPHAMTYLLYVWGASTAALAVAIIYGQTLFTHEDDQIFLDPAEAHLEKEQVVVRARVKRLRPVIAWLGAASGTLTAVLVVMWVYRGWNQ
ncbi:MAG TPA: hypothetical protein VG892_14155 [Terriglobales bacterium]|jgi:hypothetical protein|nr:hypothetical protein [Terriglobales bacterium]